MAWLKSSISISIYIALYDQYIQIDIVLDTKRGSNFIFGGSNLAGRHGLIGPHRLILVYLGRTITRIWIPGSGGAILADGYCNCIWGFEQAISFSITRIDYLFPFIQSLWWIIRAQDIIFQSHHLPPYLFKYSHAPHKDVSSQSWTTYIMVVS